MKQLMGAATVKPLPFMIGRILPKLRGFYQSLGWEETATSPDQYAVFKTAGVILSLFPIEKLAEDAGVEVHSDTNVFRGVTFSIHTPEQVDSSIEKIRHAGARILREPSDAFWGGRTAYFADPENNIWEVAWNPNSVFDERGAMIAFYRIICSKAYLQGFHQLIFPTRCCTS
jgi:catechol 2,3-dioxygenase-like lactoylglutathione lyase family enzyme